MGKKKLNVSIFEIVWYLLTGAVAIWGIVYIVLGLVAQYYPSTSEKNPLFDVNNRFTSTFGLSFLYWGLIIFGIGVVAAVACLCLTAKTTDREAEKAQRRAARLAAVETPKEEVVDAKVEETPAPVVEETKAE